MTGRKRAVEVVLVRTSREKREGEQLQKVSRFLLFLVRVHTAVPHACCVLFFVSLLFLLNPVSRVALLFVL